MRHTRQLFTIVPVVALAAAAWACSDSSSAPTAPTSTSAGVTSSSNAFAGTSAAGTAGTTASGATTGTTTSTPGTPGGQGPAGPPPLPEGQTGAVGTIGSVSGSCPSLAFTLDGTTIRTTADTIFDQSACADVKAGVKAGAAGVKQADGSIAAAHVHVGEPPAGPPDGQQPPPPGGPDGSGGKPPENPNGMPPTGPGGPGLPEGMAGAFGSVAALTGTCPAVTFTLGQTTVRATAGTTFDDSTCADLKNGVTAGAMGTKQSDGTLVAARIHVGDPPKK